MELKELQEQLLKNFYSAQIKSAILGLYIFTELQIDEIQDMITEFIHYELRTMEEAEHHRRIMKQ